jgi:hypothetical protein
MEIGDRHSGVVSGMSQSVDCQIVTDFQKDHNASALGFKEFDIKTLFLDLFLPKMMALGGGTFRKVHSHLTVDRASYLRKFESSEDCHARSRQKREFKSSDPNSPSSH